MTLLNGDPNQITEMLRSLDKHRKQIEKEIGTVVFYMQGGLNFTDAYGISMEQIALLADVIEEHYEKQNNLGNSMSKNNR
jgi:CRISPR/Cas system CMR subunit Cmr6 (Cas7 group RAMP superfamily)